MTFRPTDQTEALRNLVRELPEFASSTDDYKSGSVILEEGEPNDRLFVLAEGRATLGKRDERGEVVEVDAFGPGSILGLTSFWMREPVFAQIRATTDASCISIERSVFDELVAKYPEFARLVQYLFVSNLSDRYRHLVQSHVERARLSRQLEEERNQLRDTLSKLETATKRLINQEKLATMGQLLAGIAHEINNPIGALTSSSKAAEEALAAFFGLGKNASSLGKSFYEGLNCPYRSADEKGDRMEALKGKYPDFKRSFIRKLSQMTEIAFEIW
ncbi:MAG: cyclic nucleotide-binding domain-containing protein, partial [Verrucomicrobiota bacterium]